MIYLFCVTVTKLSEMKLKFAGNLEIASPWQNAKTTSKQLQTHFESIQDEVFIMKWKPKNIKMDFMYVCMYVRVNHSTNEANHRIEGRQFWFPFIFGWVDFRLKC